MPNESPVAKQARRLETLEKKILYDIANYDRVQTARAQEKEFKERQQIAAIATNGLKELRKISL